VTLYYSRAGFVLSITTALPSPMFVAERLV
jgi:hypothetical protein